MTKEEMDKYLGSGNMPVIDAMKKIDLNTKGIIYISDDKHRLLGSLTDGDIRRWMIKNGDLNARVLDIMFTHTKFLYQDDRAGAREFMDREKITSVPIVAPDKTIIDICFINYDTLIAEARRKSLENTSVIIMAGGKGMRLQPYTSVLPKPLIPIGGVPILERIIKRFTEYGVRDFSLVVNYKKEIIKAYFSETAYKEKISYAEETEFRGTAGGIKLLNRRFDTPVIVTNCDILIVADYDEIIKHHVNNQNKLTIVSSVKKTVIPYGVIRSNEDGTVSCMEEKPRLSHLINTGMYVMNPELVELIPEQGVFHMTDLIDKLLSMGQKVGIYPISEDSFFDMGEFEELRKMEEWVNNNYGE